MTSESEYVPESDWDQNVDGVEFTKRWTSNGFECMITTIETDSKISGKHTHRCGYVYVKDDSPLFGLELGHLADIGYISKFHTTVDYAGYDNGRYLLGFQLMDYTRRAERLGLQIPTLEDVEEEVNELARKLSSYTWADRVQDYMARTPKWFQERVAVKSVTDGGK